MNCIFCNQIIAPTGLDEKDDNFEHFLCYNHRPNIYAISFLYGKENKYRISIYLNQSFEDNISVCLSSENIIDAILYLDLYTNIIPLNINFDNLKDIVRNPKKIQNIKLLA